MAAIAVRVETLDSSNNPIAQIDFYAYEVQGIDVDQLLQRRVDRSQSGKPTDFIFGDPWHNITVNLRIHGSSTLAKLTTLRNHAKNNGTFRVYPHFRENQAEFYDCILEPPSKTLTAFSGLHRGGDSYTMEFQETDKSSQVVSQDDIIIT